MELRRREPSGPRPRRHPRVHDRRSHRPDFLEHVFQKLLLNFTWWLNRQDPDGNNLFGGGFLGLDNISPIDRSHLPPGCTRTGRRHRVDGLLLASDARRSRRPLAARNDVYDDMVVKFLEQFVIVIDALEQLGFLRRRRRLLLRPPARTRSGNTDGDQGADARRGDPGAACRIGPRRGIGAAHACATVRPPDGARPTVARPRDGGSAPTGDASSCSSRSCRPDQLNRVFATLVRRGGVPVPVRVPIAVQAPPTPYAVPGVPDAVIDYEPAESRTSMYGGNSNWRGPCGSP